MVRPAPIAIDHPPAPTGRLGPNSTTVTVAFSDATTTTVEARFGRLVGQARADTLTA